MIGEEVIEYTSVTGNTIGGNIVRGDNPVTYPIGTPVFKYELGGVNLHRINKTCLLYTSPSPRDLSTSRMPSSA